MSVGGAGKGGNAKSSARAPAAAAKAAEAAAKAEKATAEKTRTENVKAENAKGTYGPADFFKDFFAPAPKTSPTSPKPSADWGVNETGFQAGVAAIKGREPKTGIEVELYSAGVQAGRQTEVQAGMARLGVSSDNGVHSLRGDVFTGRVGAGTQNPDGSVGANVSVSATVVGAEATVGFRGNSLTVGLAFGGGLEGSIGQRDIDGDGRIEGCVRAGVRLATVGLCVEPLVD